MMKNEYPRRAMILAAGRGKRLRPLTDHIPKPLVEVGGVSLIEHHLQKLSQLKVQDVVINHAWLGEKIESAIQGEHRYGLNIHFSAETEGALETAGGIINALPWLSDQKEPFLIVNGDVFTDMDFATLLDKKLPDGILAHLVMVPTPDFKDKGDFGLDASGQIIDSSDYTFSGISLLHPDLFRDLTPGFRPLAPLLREAIALGQVSGELFQGYWNDVGTLDRLEAAREDYQMLCQ